MQMSETDIVKTADTVLIYLCSETGQHFATWTTVVFVNFVH